MRQHMIATHDENKKPQRQRMPAPLQKVYTDSCRGKDVKLVPPHGLSSTTFHRNWVFQLRRGSMSSTGEHGSKSFDDLMCAAGSTSCGGLAEMSKSVRRLKVECAGVFPAAKNFQWKSDGREKNGGQFEKSSVAENMDPQTYLDLMIGRRGYSTRKYRTLNTGYYAKPTPLQRASHSVHIIRLIQRKDYDKLKAILESGLSPNPCNAYGESLIHMVCRRGDARLLKVQLDAGANVQVSDDYGRTPLHDVCWRKRPSFDMVSLLAEKDLNLFHMLDKHGSGPLSYIRKEHWPQWIYYLESKMDKWWPIRDKNAGEQVLSPLVEQFPDSRRIANPPNALTTELAKMVASGAISPEDADLYKFDHTSSDTFLATDSSDDNSDDETDDDSIVIPMARCMDRRCSQTTYNTL